MSRLSGKFRKLALIGVLAPLIVLFVYVGFRSGPLAPVSVTVVAVESRALVPSLFGIGTVEARYTHRIGPSAAGRALQVNVNVGDKVKAGQLLGEMDPVDLNERITAQAAAVQRARAAVLAAEARVQDVLATYGYARSQQERYEKLFLGKAASDEAVNAKRHEYQVAEARVRAARADLEAVNQELLRSQADYEGLLRRREDLRLIAPVNGLVTARHIDSGSTIVTGQAVVEVIEPASLWINVRFDQLGASGLQPGLAARVTLRSRAAHPLAGRVLRIEPLADAVTEELLVKVVFDVLPEPLPPLGELAEVIVVLPPLPETPVISNAAIRRISGQSGVWAIDGKSLRFVPVQVGTADLDGLVQIVDGLKIGDRIILYSPRALTARSRIKIVDRLPGVRP